MSLLVIAVGCSGGGAGTPPLNSSGYNIIYENNPASEQWGDYLYRQLLNRAHEQDIVLFNEKKENFKTIKIEVDSRFECDYCIDHDDEQLLLKAKNNQAAAWLIYQFIKRLSCADRRFTTDDLPPAILNCKSHCANFDFSYREPFFSPNLRHDYTPIIATNNVDDDWGIWGHNLSRVLYKDAANAVYAKQDGVLHVEQYCFSSEETFKQIKEYIVNTWGDGSIHTQRFMIMPKDNNVVCNCDLCKANGNTANNATPAISALIKRLAAQFPNHMFFTSAYITTQSPPKEQWPANTGVMLSTIDLPKGIALDNQKEVIGFIHTLNNWKNCTPNIYVWDYAANFDDYLSPLPVLYGLKEQLKFFKSNGIKGVFLNASGYDYSPFDDVKTYVSASLMINTNVSVDSLCHEYLTQFYPKTGALLSNYYLSLEKALQRKNKPYDMYGGFDRLLSTYLDKDKFVEFYNAIGEYLPITEGDERLRLEKLYTALSFTRLQLAYYQKGGQYGFAEIKNNKVEVKPDIEVICKRLLHYKQFNDLMNYKEFGGDLELYLNNWRKMVSESPLTNRLMSVPIEVLSELDEDYNQINMLNDGVLGFDGEYHQGWLLSSVDDLYLRFPTTNLNDIKKISMRFLVDEKHRIYPPVKVEVYKNNTTYKGILADKKNDGTMIREVTIDVDLSDADVVALKVFRRQSEKSIIACDEIWLNE